MTEGQPTPPVLASASDAIARVHDDSALFEQPPAKRLGVGASGSNIVPQKTLNDVLAQLVKIQLYLSYQQK